VIAASQTIASDQHGKAIRDGGWLEDDFFVLDQPEEKVNRAKEYRSRQYAKEKAAKEADEGPSAKKDRENSKKDYCGEPLSEKRVLKKTADGIPLLFVGPNLPPPNFDPLQPQGGMTRDEWVQQHNQQPAYGLKFGERRAKDMAVPNSLVKFVPQPAIPGVITSGREWMEAMRKEAEKEAEEAAREE
jgi:hypothetical protein